MRFASAHEPSIRDHVCQVTSRARCGGRSTALSLEELEIRRDVPDQISVAMEAEGMTENDVKAATRLAWKNLLTIGCLLAVGAVGMWLTRSGDERPELEAELRELEVRYEAAMRNDAMLRGLVVESATFISERANDLGTGPIILQTVRNETGQALSEVRFKAIVREPGRTIPHIDAVFSYEIPGGIEPGETLTWSLLASQRHWRVATPSTAVMEVEPIGLWDANGDSLVDEVRLSDADLQRLEELRVESASW